MKVADYYNAMGHPLASGLAYQAADTFTKGTEKLIEESLEAQGYSPEQISKMDKDELLALISNERNELFSIFLGFSQLGRSVCSDCFYYFAFDRGLIKND